MKIFSYEPSSPGNRNENFLDKIALLSNHTSEDGINNFCLVCISTWRVGELTLLVEFLRVHKATTATNDTSLRSTI